MLETKTVKEWCKADPRGVLNVLLDELVRLTKDQKIDGPIQYRASELFGGIEHAMKVCALNEPGNDIVIRSRIEELAFEVNQLSDREINDVLNEALALPL